MIEAETIDAMPTIRLLEPLELLYPLMVCIHVFPDNARYHHARIRLRLEGGALGSEQLVEAHPSA
jgi:hypothetical protein